MYLMGTYFDERDEMTMDDEMVTNETALTQLHDDLPQLAVVTPRLPKSQHPAVVFLASLASDHSRYHMQRHLSKIAQMLTGDEKADAFSVDWAQVRYPHSAAIRARLMQQYRPATVNVMLSALRGVLKESWRLGHMDAETYQRAVDVANVKSETLPSGRHIAFGEIQALANACYADESSAGARDSAIIGLLAVCGVRRSELIALTLADVDLDTGEIKVRQGKGKKERIVWLRGGALQAMQDWLQVRDEGLTTEVVFVPINKGGNQQDRGMTPKAIYKIIQKRVKEASVKHASPHDFRRTMVSEMLAKGADVLTVQKVAGHASSDTTRRYDLRDESFKQEAAEKLHYPHRSRQQKTLL